MKKELIIPFMIFFFTLCQPLWAKETSINLSNASKKVYSGRNPFESQLPKKSKETDAMGLRPATINSSIINSSVMPPVVPAVTTQQRAQQAPKMTMPTLTINGLVWNTNRPQAIINNQVIDVGDRISDVEVLAINKKGVSVSFQGSKILLRP